MGNDIDRNNDIDVNNNFDFSFLKNWKILWIILFQSMIYNSLSKKDVALLLFIRRSN